MSLDVIMSEEPLTDSEWDSLRPRLTPEFRFLAGRWIEPWREHLQHEGSWDGDFRYIVTRDHDGSVLGAIPFAVQRKSRFSLLSLAGPYLPVRGFPVAADSVDAVAHSVVHFLTEHPPATLLRMAPIAAWDPTTARLLAILKERGWRLRTTADARRQVINLPSSVEEYAAERKGSRWSTFARRERKMAREKSAALEVYTTETCPDWEPVIRDMGAVELESWLPQKHGDMWFVRDHDRCFWRQALSVPQSGLAARAWVLYWDGKPVAFNFNFDSGPCRYHIAGHYAEFASAYSPGAILMRHMVEDAIERGVSFIDMGGGDPGYKAFWGSQPQSEATLECLAFPPTIRGRALERLVAGFGYVNRLRASASARIHRLRGSN